jgi:hypothetical protein
VLIVFVLTALGVILLGCSTASRRRVIVYDQPWSSAAGVKNLVCASEYRTSCERQALEMEAEFRKRLPTTFRASPECSTVEFFVLSGDGQDSKDLEDKLARNPGNKYWRLRVDFHPMVTGQPFYLGTDKHTSLVGGDDAEHQAGYICKAAKQNGIMDIW